MIFVLINQLQLKVKLPTIWKVDSAEDNSENTPQLLFKKKNCVLL